jgi:Zinc finger, ZZ type
LGLVYSCKSCPDYGVCTKCIASTATFHSPTTKHDGLPHNFERNTDYDEFKDPPLAQPETDGDEEVNRTSGVGSPLERHHSGDSDAGVGADSSGVEDEMEIDEYV